MHISERSFRRSQTQELSVDANKYLTHRKYCNINGRSIVIQMGGVLPCLECSWITRTQKVRQSGKKKAHKHKLFGPVPLGRPRECPTDKPGLSLGQAHIFRGTTWVSPYFAQWKPSLSQGQTQGNPGDEGRQRKFMCSKFMCLVPSLIRIK